MKKIIAVVLASMCLLSASAYADAKDDRIAELEAQVEEMQKTIDELTAKLELITQSTSQDEDAPIVYFKNASGTTENGNSLVIYGNGDPRNGDSITVCTEGLDGSLLSYFYIDGVQVDTAQLSHSEYPILITGSPVMLGVHIIELKQFADNDESGEELYSVSAQYEVKES